MTSIDNEKLNQLYEKRKEKILQLIQNMQHSQELDAGNVFEPYNPKNRELVFEIVEDYILPQSDIINTQHLETLFLLAKEGHSCIIMSEHYSNFDTIGLYYIIRKKYPQLMPLFEHLVFLASSKLNTEHKMVLAFSESMSRLIVHQVRSKEKDTLDPEKASLLESVTKQSFLKMQELKTQGNIIFMFPSGTRFREGDQNSRKAIKQTASFLKRFDYVCFLGIKGNVLKINASAEMFVDELYLDSLIYLVDAPKKCSEVIAAAKTINLEDLPNDDGKLNSATMLKQQVSQYVTDVLLELHEKATETYNSTMDQKKPLYIGKVL